MSVKYDVIVIGGGQAGLATGYFLSKLGLDYQILDASQRTGDQWRRRWDSLRLFTPARFNSLPGMRYPAPAHYFPSKDEFGAFLEAYAAQFNLPVRTGMQVTRLAKEGDHFLVQAGEQQLIARQVVVAMANYQKPRLPEFAGQLDRGIVQLHSSEYRNPAQLQDGKVLIVGAGNSGAEIAVEVGRTHPTWVAGRSPGELPFDIRTRAGRQFFAPVTLRILFHRILTTSTPVGRKARPGILSKAGPLIRTKEEHMRAVGVNRVPRMSGVQAGQPLLADGQVLPVKNVIWCTGYRSGFPEWIDLPVFSGKEPRHYRGVAAGVPGLYFVGLHFLYALSSAMVQGVGRDAGYIARQIAARARARQQAPIQSQPSRT